MSSAIMSRALVGIAAIGSALLAGNGCTEENAADRSITTADRVRTTSATVAIGSSSSAARLSALSSAGIVAAASAEVSAGGAVFEQPLLGTRGADRDGDPHSDQEAWRLACKAKKGWQVPPWLGLERCSEGGFIYATASVAGVRDLGLARTVAADRARKALAPRVKSGGEVIDSFRCGGQLHALARTSVESEDTTTATCDARRLAEESTPKKGCPAWTRRVVWREGGKTSAVGTARVRNRALAEATAANRARAELVKISKTYTELSRTPAACDGYTYVLIVAQELEEETH